MIRRHEYITLTDISDLWERSALNETGNPLPERTFHNHRKSIEEIFGIEIKFNKAREYYLAGSDDAEKAMHYTPVFKQVGMQMILFAKEEPMLFQLCYMTDSHNVRTFEGIYQRLGDVAYACVDVIQRDYDLSEKDARALFEHVWIHTFGIGALCATGMCDFSEEQIIEMLGHDFVAMLIHIKSGKMNQPTVHPVQNTEE